MELPIRYSYGWRWGRIFRWMILGSGFALVQAAAVRTDGRGLRLFKIVEFGPPAAAVFHLVLALFAAGGAVVACLNLFQRILRPRVLELGTETMSVPKGFFRSEVETISYVDIEDLWEHRHNWELDLRVHLPKRIVTIPRALLPSRKSYKQMKAILVTKIRPSEAWGATRFT